MLPHAPVRVRGKIYLQPDSVLPPPFDFLDIEEFLLLDLSYNDALGLSGATISMSLLDMKYSSTTNRLDRYISDGSWVDLEFIVGKQIYHEFRGIITSLSSDLRLESGATENVTTIQAKAWSSIFEMQSVYVFNYKGINEHFLNARLRELLGNTERMSTREQVTLGHLRNYFSLGSEVAAQWTMPTMPGIGADAWVSNVDFLVSLTEYEDLEKVIWNTWSIPFDEVNPWSQAVEYCDNQYTEILPRLTKEDGTLPAQGENLLVGDSTMTVLYRDKPYPTRFDFLRWRDARTFEFALEDFVALSLQRSDAERYNMITTNTPIIAEQQELMRLFQPIANEVDIERRGVRRFTANSVYGDKKGQALRMANKDRETLVDYYALNPYYYTGVGTIETWVCGLHPGDKVRVVDSVGQQEWNLYVSSVNKDISFGPGDQPETSIQFIRGWYGDDTSLFEALEVAIAEWRVID